MKNRSIYVLVTIVFVSLLLFSCTSTAPEIPVAVEIEEPIAEPTEVVGEPEEPATQEEPLAEVPTELQARFTILAEGVAQDPVTVLYEAFFDGESPVFVEDSADLIAQTATPYAGGRPIVEATYLPNSVFVPINEAEELSQFIEFAISPDGQQVLIDNNFLPESITLVDQAGNTVDIAQPVRRIISAYGPSTAMVYTVGGGARFVSAGYLGARDPQGAAAMERIDPDFPEKDDGFFGQSLFSVERAADLDPDLVTASIRSDWLDVAEELNITIFLFSAETPAELKEAILLTGELLGPHSQAQAEALVAYYQYIIDQIAAITASIPLDQRPRVLFTGTEPLRVASGEMLQSVIIDLAGGVSVTSELFGFWNDVNIEQVAVWDPDVIIVPPYGGASVAAIIESPEWQILDAVREGRVYRMPKLVAPWDTPAPDSVLGIIWMAQLLNPDGAGLSCAEETAYFYNTFYNYAISPDEIASLCVFD